MICCFLLFLASSSWTRQNGKTERQTCLLAMCKSQSSVFNRCTHVINLTVGFICMSSLTHDFYFQYWTKSFIPAWFTWKHRFGQGAYCSSNDCWVENWWLFKLDAFFCYEQGHKLALRISLLGCDEVDFSWMALVRSNFYFRKQAPTHFVKNPTDCCDYCPKREVMNGEV